MSKEVMAETDLRAKAQEEKAWLVEIQPSGGPQWWTGRGDEWTPYVDGSQRNPTLSAMRFAREEDANRAIGWLVDKGVARGAKATEHIWL